jgi:hypothetical protein
MLLMEHDPVSVGVVKDNVTVLLRELLLSLKRQWLLYTLPGITFQYSTFCPQSALGV